MNYSEVVAAWKQSREQWREYEFTCAQIAYKIYMTLQKSLELKDGKLLKLVDPEEKDEEKLQKTIFSPSGSVKLADKGWAKFGLHLVLQLGDNTWPKFPMRFISYIKIEKDLIKFKAVANDDETVLSINYDDADEQKIIAKYEGLMRINVIDNFRIWHDER